MKLTTCLVLSLLLSVAYFQACSSGCFECEPSSGKCTACIEDYALTILGGCVKNTIANCNLFLNSTFCIRCSPTYYVQDNACLKDLSGCYKNITKTKCGTCSAELILINGTCFGVFNCVRYAKDMSCASCDQGFSLVGGVCVAGSENCLSGASQRGVCAVCQHGFTLIGYKCISAAYYNPNCQIYDSYGRCSICQEGYVLYQSNCYGQNEVQLIKNLNSKQSPIISQDSAQRANVSNKSENTQDLKANSSSQATPTTQGNSSNSAGALKIGNISAVPAFQSYCKRLEGEKCVQCYSNFHLQLGTCKVNNPLCREIYPNGSCKSCYPTYQLQVDTCIILPAKATQTLEVINEFRSPPQTNDQNCVRTNSSKCLECVNGYYLNISGQCSLPKPHCIRFNLTDGSCFACTVPYILINNQCIYPTANCLLYNLNNECYQCSQGFNLQEKACYANDITCAAYDIIGRCTKCVETYYLVANACVFPALGYDPYCTKYSNSYCTSCLVGYFLEDYRCSKVDPQCISFDYERPKQNPSGSGCL